MSYTPAARATWRQFFFSPTGRFTRSQYWGSTILLYGALLVYSIPVIAFPDRNGDWSVAQIIYATGFVVFTIAVTVSQCFATVKRFHDRDKPWPWIFIGLIPYIGGLWVLIECGFLPGKPGRNRFGSDPLNPEGDIVDVFGGPSAALPPRADPNSLTPNPEPRFAADFDPRTERPI